MANPGLIDLDAVADSSAFVEKAGSSLHDLNGLMLAAPKASSSSEDTGRSSPVTEPTNDDAVPTEETELDGDDTDQEDQYRFAVKQKGPRPETEKRRSERAAFQEWLDTNQKDLNTKGTRQIDEHTLASLASDSWNQKIISQPREYQVELFNRAKAKNTIVVLDTGSGKTLISALLLRHTLSTELEDRALNKAQPRVAFFLVEKVALCYQQYTVLSSNLEHKVAMFYGERNDTMKSKEYWDQQLSENMVIVCTAQILLDCLNDGFINMRQINLLVFDEAHHTKKNHPYARIIKHHYLREPEERRPRILGMTASPVDSQTKDLQAAALELESLMCSEIATVSDEVLEEMQARKKSSDTIEYYTPLHLTETSRSQLWIDIRHLLGQYERHLRQILVYTDEASSTLGRWCADRFWQLYLTNEEVSRLIPKVERDYGYAYGEHAASIIHSVQGMVKNHELPSLAVPDDHRLVLSSKLLSLVDVLKDAFHQFGTSRAIVFVEQRYTAILLAELFRTPEMAIPGVLTDFMVGSKPGAARNMNMTFKDQVVVLRKFKQGEINCLFATPVAEEGIDIPDCDLIVRFDLYHSVIQYIQSKGRARQHTSRYVSMLEMNNSAELRRMLQANRDTMILRRFCSSLPADRKIEDHNIDAVEAASLEHMSFQTYEIPSTGARLTFLHSLEVLAKFVASLYQGQEVSPRAEYIVMPIGNKYTADVILPEASPIKSVSGRPQRGKQLARCSAAFEACVQLIKKKYINDNLQPTFTKRLPALRNARLAVSEKKKAEYPMRIKPEFWSVPGERPGVLFLAMIKLDEPEAVGDATSPLLLLTRQVLPTLPKIPLYFGNGASTKATITPLSTPVSVSSEQVEALTQFTSSIFTDVFSKEFEAGAHEWPYFLAPMSEAGSEAPGALAVDWGMVRQIVQSGYLDPEEFSSEQLMQQMFVVDPFDGGRKLMLKGVNKDLQPSDPTPADAAPHRVVSYRSGEHTIKEYSNSLWQKARQRAVWREDQPVFNAEVLSLRRNLLDDHDDEREERQKCYVILEPLKVSSLPLPIVHMAMRLPAILHRIDSNLIALEACKMLDVEVLPHLALEAMTKDSQNTGDHGAEQVDFQPGMGSNYERLEFLGDTFLKMATTIAVFTLMPAGNEFDYHVERMCLICNQNLFNHAVDRGLQEYIRSKSFDRRAWYPHLKLKKGKALKTEMRQNLADKSIADVCEALIGAAYLSQDASGTGMDMAVKAVTTMVKNRKHKFTTFKEYHEAYLHQVPKWQTGETSAAHRHTAELVAQSTGYVFKHPTLLRSAFKHPSYPYESRIPHYQRLEFLGDALLDMAIVDYLFRRFPNADPQWLTEHKMAMVSNQFLACLGVKLGLQKHLLSITPAIISSTAEYVMNLQYAEEKAQEEAEQSQTGQPMRQDFWLQAGKPPKAIADIAEALVGAMFVDSGYDFEVVRTFFKSHVAPFFQDMAIYDTFASKHPVTALGHLLEERFSCSRWRICTSAVPASVEEGAAAMTATDLVCGFMVHEKVIAHATSQSGRYGKIAVANKALGELRDMDVAEFKAKVGCDCKGGNVGGDHGTAV